MSAGLFLDAEARKKTGRNAGGGGFFAFLCAPQHFFSAPLRLRRTVQSVRCSRPHTQRCLRRVAADSTRVACSTRKNASAQRIFHLLPRGGSLRRLFGSRLRSGLRLRVPIFHDVRLIERDRCAAVGNLDFRRPQDAIHHELALAVGLPVRVPVRTRECEVAPAVLALIRPADRLGAARVCLCIGARARLVALSPCHPQPRSRTHPPPQPTAAAP